MDPNLTPAPVTEISSEITEAVTKITTTGVDADDGDLAALIGGVVSAVLVLLICIITVLLWCLSRHKGSYVTNETDDDDINDDESVGSDTALQSKEPLKKKDEE